jgi:hypothetical protein
MVPDCDIWFIKSTVSIYFKTSTTCFAYYLHVLRYPPEQDDFISAFLQSFEAWKG